MSLVQDVLEWVNNAGGVVDLGELSRETGIQTTALLGILDLCVRKGYLATDQRRPPVTCRSCPESHTCVLACEKASRRPLVYRLVSPTSPR